LIGLLREIALESQSRAGAQLTPGEGSRWRDTRLSPSERAAALVAAVRSGAVDEALIDRALGRVLAQKAGGCCPKSGLTQCL
jgi:hypothetical protein